MKSKVQLTVCRINLSSCVLVGLVVGESICVSRYAMVVTRASSTSTMLFIA